MEPTHHLQAGQVDANGDGAVGAELTQPLQALRPATHPDAADPRPDDDKRLTASSEIGGLGPQRPPITTGTTTRSSSMGEEDDDEVAFRGKQRVAGSTRITKRTLASAGLLTSDDSDDEVDVRRRLRRGSMQSRSGSGGATGEPTRSPDTNAMGRRLRIAVIAAKIAWRETSCRQSGSAIRRRARSAKGSIEQDAGGESQWTEALLNRLVDRMVTREGQILYRADWVDYDTEDDRYTWEPVENLQGHEDWMGLVDLWKDKHEGTRSFSAFAKSNAIRIGAGEEMRCFFHAVHAVQHLLNLADFDLHAAEANLQARGWDFAGGVKKDTLIPLMEAVTKSGLKVNYIVWNKNLRTTEMGGGALGIVTAARDPGVYMVFTIDPRRLGHCWVLHQDEDSNLFAYDNGGKVDFADIRFGEIIWIRKCVPFQWCRRRSRFQRKRDKSNK